MDWDCMNCGHEHQDTDSGFGDDITCMSCGAVHETDFDYLDATEGVMSFWVVGLKNAGSDKEGGDDG